MSRPATSASEPPAGNASTLATQWYRQLAASTSGRVEFDGAPGQVGTIAAFAGIVLSAGATLLILVPDDEPLPALSTALDLAIRPLCLVLPSADFAARIALRATISLLRSRLARDGEDEQGDVWRAQRSRLADNAVLWQETQRWSAANDRSPWPAEVARLFPVRILPIAAYRALPVQAADYALCYRCDLDPASRALFGRQVVIGGREATPLHRAVALGDETVRLRAELAQLTQDVGELELELATAQGELGAFTQRYCELIVPRMTQLDGLRAALAQSAAKAVPEDGEKQSAAERMRREAEASAAEQRRFASAGDAGNADRPSPATPFRPGQEVKRVFRQLAQKIHPDRAVSEDDRAWRTQLMSEANRAYRAGNLDALREVAALWDEGPAGRDEAPAARDVLAQQVARMRRRLADIEAELNRVFGSPLYELFAASRQAARSGRDLLREMVTALDAQIAACGGSPESAR